MPTCSTKVHIITPPVIASYARAAGVRGYNLTIAVALALAESAGNQYAMDCDSNGSIDYGLWQINSIHGYDPQRLLDDPAYNAAAMYSVSDHGTKWSPWVTYNNGAYKKYLGQSTAAGSPQSGGAPQPTPEPGKKPGEPGGVNKPGGGSIFSIPGLEQLKEFIELITEPIKILIKGEKWLANKQNWIRIMEVIAGGVLLAIAVKELFHIEAPTPVPIPV